MKFKSHGNTFFSNWYAFEITDNNQKIDNVVFKMSPYTNERQICIYDEYAKCKYLFLIKDDTILAYESNDILNIKEMKQLLSRFFGV